MTTSTATPSMVSHPLAPVGRRLERSNDRMIGGVAAGLAEHFEIDVSLVRIAFVALALTTGSGLLLYLVMWLVLPEAATATNTAPPAPAAAPSPMPPTPAEGSSPPAQTS